MFGPELPFLLLLASPPVTPVGPPQDAKPFKIEVSPSDCAITAEHHLPGVDLPRQVWLRSNAAGQPTLLTTYERDASLVFSPDCGMIALNDNLGSDTSEVRLFRRVDKLEYSPVPFADVTGKAWAALRRALGAEQPLEQLAHMYVNAIVWSSDSRALLLHAWGHTDVDNRVDDWFCVYDLKSGQISLDLETMNRNSVILKGRVRNTQAGDSAGPRAVEGSTAKPSEPSRIVVTAPTIIGYFPAVDEGELEKNDGLNSALEHLEMALEKSAACFAANGVRVQKVFADRIGVVDDGRAVEIAPTRSPDGLGAFLVSPGRSGRFVDGGAGPSSLISHVPAAAAEYFDLPACDFSKSSDER